MAENSMKINSVEENSVEEDSVEENFVEANTVEGANWLNNLSDSFQLKQITDLNDKTAQFGITISKEDALQLIQDRKQNLKEHRRMEFGEGILPKLIMAFCDSSYIYQQNFVEVMGRLQDIFYEYKNESMDELTDDELIAFMYEAFEGECQGSPDYLEETVLEEFARNIRARDRNFLAHYFKRGIFDEG